jgi:hypothetical protein
LQSGPCRGGIVQHPCGLTYIGSLESRIGTLSIEKQEKLEQDAAKAEKKAEKKAEQEQKKKDVSLITPPDVCGAVNNRMLTKTGCQGTYRPTSPARPDTMDH